LFVVRSGIFLSGFVFDVSSTGTSCAIGIEE